MDYHVAFWLEKMKAERSKWFYCKTSRFLFLVYVFKENTQKLFQICLTP